MEKTESSYENIIHGSTYKVVLESAENAKLTYEELIKKRCQQETEALPPDKIDPNSA